MSSEVAVLQTPPLVPFSLSPQLIDTLDRLHRDYGAWVPEQLQKRGSGFRRPGWDFAYACKGVPEFAKLGPEATLPIVKAWMALRNLSWLDFGFQSEIEGNLAFIRNWMTAKYALGQEPLTVAYNKSLDYPIFLLDEHWVDSSGIYEQCMSLFYQLALLGGGEFYAPCEKTGDLVGASRETIRYCRDLGVHQGLITQVSQHEAPKGKGRKGKATGFRFNLGRIDPVTREELPIGQSVDKSAYDAILARPIISEYGNVGVFRVEQSQSEFQTVKSDSAPVVVAAPSPANKPGTLGELQPAEDVTEDKHDLLEGKLDSAGHYLPEFRPEHLSVSNHATPDSVLVPIVKEVFNTYIETLGHERKQYLLTPTRRKIGILRLRDLLRHELVNGEVGAAVFLMNKAIASLANSPWHRGNNPQRVAYTDWDKHLFGTWETLENWLNR